MTKEQLSFIAGHEVLKTLTEKGANKPFLSITADGECTLVVTYEDYRSAIKELAQELLGVDKWFIDSYGLANLYSKDGLK